MGRMEINFDDWYSVCRIPKGSLEETGSELGLQGPASAERWREDWGESVTGSAREELHERHDVHVPGVPGMRTERAMMRHEAGDANRDRWGHFS